MRRLCSALVLVAALAAGTSEAQAAILPGQTIDGPSADIKEFGNIDVAPDGTGALVYRKNVGLNHAIFVSRIANGAFGAPERVDVPASTNVASRPRVAASNGGRLVVVWLGAGGVGTPFGRGAVSPGSDQQFQQADVPAGAAYISADVDANPSGGTYLTGTQNVNGGDV